MRLSLIDIILLSGLFAAGAALCAPALLFVRPMTVVPFAVVGGVGVVLGCGSPLYRYLRFRPLFVPVCPHCRRRPLQYEIYGGGWPLELVRCGSCRRATFLWYPADIPPAELVRLAPVAQPRWPFVLGNWQVTERTCSRGADQQTARA